MAFCRGLSRSLPAFVFDNFGGDFGDLGLADVEGDFVTAIGVPEFGGAGLFEVSVVEEAAGELGRADEDFVVFINASTDAVNVLYRRADGGLGLVEPVA